MFDRFAKALKVAVLDEGFVQILGAGFLLVAVGTITYTTSQDWSLVDGFYFAVATRRIEHRRPGVTITGTPIEIFTVFYIWVGVASWSNSLDNSAPPTSRYGAKRRGESRQSRTHSRDVAEFPAAALQAFGRVRALSLPDGCRCEPRQADVRGRRQGAGVTPWRTSPLRWLQDRAGRRRPHRGIAAILAEEVRAEDAGATMRAPWRRRRGCYRSGGRRRGLSRAPRQGRRQSARPRQSRSGRPRARRSSPHSRRGCARPAPSRLPAHRTRRPRPILPTARPQRGTGSLPPHLDLFRRACCHRRSSSRQWEPTRRYMAPTSRSVSNQG